MVETTHAGVIAYRRTEQGFVAERYRGLKAVIPLPEIEIDLPLSELYDRVELIPEPEPGE